MIDGIIFEDSEDFCSWWQEINMEDKLDKQEAMLIYFNLETYDNVGNL